MTHDHALDLPARLAKPRRYGLTMMIDPGLPPGYFCDVVDGASELVDLVKFGWGTSLVSPSLSRKVAALAEAAVPFSFGGTLFEKHFVQDRFGEYLDWCRRWHCRHVEISDGTVDMTAQERAHCVATAAEDFVVMTEVGFKDPRRSDGMGAGQWVERIRRDLDAGAAWVIIEARESGRGGICRSDGSLRIDVVEEILLSGVDVDRLIFEAPTKDLQSYLIRRLGPNVNLGNVAAADLVALETLRLGLRSDTFSHFEEQRRVLHA